MAVLSEQEQVRREKLQALRELGINPYPAPLYPVDHTSAEIKATFTEEELADYIFYLQDHHTSPYFCKSLRA